MATSTHQYNIEVEWTGNKGSGTAGYNSYERSHTVKTGSKTAIECSSDPAFRGDPDVYNPEELFVSSISSCHMLWYLHLCTKAGIVVLEYNDIASGVMIENEDGSGYFKEIWLHPVVRVADETMIATANSLHEEAHKYCFLANSVNFPVGCKPTCIVESYYDYIKRI